MYATNNNRSQAPERSGYYKVILPASGILAPRYHTFEYRTTNGITELRDPGNSFSKWTVGNIPSGAELVKHY